MYLEVPYSFYTVRRTPKKPTVNLEKHYSTGWFCVWAVGTLQLLLSYNLDGMLFIFISSSVACEPSQKYSCVIQYS